MHVRTECETNTDFVPTPLQEYDVHNIFGHQIMNATYQGLLSVFPGKRPFIIGRSSFAGSGKWAGHWGGDNASKWAYMCKFLRFKSCSMIH